MRRRMALGMVGVLLALTALGLNALGIEPVVRIIPQPDSPVRITDYSAYYSSGTTYTNKGIRHDVQCQNVSGRTIVAFEFGLVSFSVFNEFLDRTGGVSLDELSPGATDQGAWIASATSDFMFLTGVVYVSRVRYSNGEIWVADLNYISSELSKIEQGFDITHLKEK